MGSPSGNGVSKSALVSNILLFGGNLATGRWEGVAKGSYAIRPKSIYLDLINRRLRKGGGGGAGGGLRNPNQISHSYYSRGGGVDDRGGGGGK